MPFYLLVKSLFRTVKASRSSSGRNSAPRNRIISTYQNKTHVFVIKIWAEADDPESSSGIWRGHITHIPGDQRIPLKELSDIVTFIRPYVAKLNVDLTDQDHTDSASEED